jgi:hypothetical protein
MGAITEEERAAVRSRSAIGVKYDAAVNRESAYEILTRRTEARTADELETPTPGSPRTGPPRSARTPTARTAGPRPQGAPPPTGADTLGDLLWGTKRRQGMVETMAKQAARTMGSQVGRQILRGVLGGIFGGSRR